jgi:hypothetical protein
MSDWDLSEPVRKDRPFPWYLPSINKMFVTPCSTPADKQRKGVHLKSLPDTGQLSFLLKDSFFYYPNALYSAGVAEWDIGKSKINDKAVLKRDRLNTFMLADSAGYQVSTDALPIDWDKPEKTMEPILRWQEHMADVGMYLDIPSRLRNVETFEKKNKAGEIVKSTSNRFFGDQSGILQRSVDNYEFFASLKPKIKMLKPIQGETIDEVIDWYKAVKHIPCCGYAFASPMTKNYGNLLAAIDYIWRDGGFDEGQDKYLHIFGRGSPSDGVALTALMWALRQFVSPDIRVTFDSSSPVLASGRYGQVLKNATYLPDGNIPSQPMDSFCKQAKDVNRDLPFPYAHSPVLNVIPLKEIFRAKVLSKETGADREMDGLSYSIISSHNIFVLLQTIYTTLNKVLLDYAYLSEQIDDRLAGKRELLDPHVDWDNLGWENPGPLFYELLAQTKAVLNLDTHDKARNWIDKNRGTIFNKAFKTKSES